MKGLNTPQKREKVFARPHGMPLDRAGKARVMANADAYNEKYKAPGQHRGPLTRVTLEVLRVLLWEFHNSKSGSCFPSYESIAKKAQCCRDSVCVAIKALEKAGIITWVNCLSRIRTASRDLAGRMVHGWKVIRTSNFYLFRDPLPCAPERFFSKSENPPRTQYQDSFSTAQAVKVIVLDPRNPLEAALARLGEAGGFLSEA